VASNAEIRANLNKLQGQLQSSSSARTGFLKDPASVLERQGLTLPPDRRTALKRFVDKQVAVPNSRVTGATIRPGSNPMATEVEISVSVKF
jgi:hypothetical protein